MIPYPHSCLRWFQSLKNCIKNRKWYYMLYTNFLQEVKAMKNLQCSREEENVNKLSDDSCHLEMGNIKGSRSSEWHLKSQDGFFQTIRIGCDLPAAYVPFNSYLVSNLSSCPRNTKRISAFLRTCEKEDCPVL
jgi:hypothetical protein